MTLTLPDWLDTTPDDVGKRVHYASVHWRPTGYVLVRDVADLLVFSTAFFLHQLS